MERSQKMHNFEVHSSWRILNRYWGIMKSGTKMWDLWGIFFYIQKGWTYSKNYLSIHLVEEEAKDNHQCKNKKPAFNPTHSRTSSSTSQSSKSATNEMSSNIDRLVQLQLQLHEWKEEDLNNYKRKIALQQKEVTEATGSSSEEISAIGQNSPKRSKYVPSKDFLLLFF